MDEAGVWHVAITYSHSYTQVSKYLTATEARALVRATGLVLNPWSNHAILDEVNGQTFGLPTYPPQYQPQHPMVQTGLNPAQLFYHQGTTLGALMRGPVNFYMPGAISVDYWGPAGEILEIWPKPDDYDQRRQAVQTAVELVNRTNQELFGG